MIAICPVCESELNIKRSGMFECEVCGHADHEANLTTTKRLMKKIDKLEKEKEWLITCLTALKMLSNNYFEMIDRPFKEEKQ